MGGRTAILLRVGNSNGKPNNWGELYFATNGVVPATVQDVALCVETYDAAADQVIAADYSGTNTAGPLQRAYNAAPQAYLTAGIKKWWTLAFTFTGINFQKGASGAGRENAQADFRVQVGPPMNGAVYFDRAWLVTQGVPAAKAATKL